MTDLMGELRICSHCKKDFRDRGELRTCANCACHKCGTLYRVGIWCFPCNGSGDHELGAFYKGDHNIHTSERVTLFRNPHTGETRIPGRADREIHPKYKAAGFTERVQLETHQEIRKLEKEQGLVHESSSYNQNSVQAEKDTGSR